jgi:hypothetical protein
VEERRAVGREKRDLMLVNGSRHVEEGSKPRSPGDGSGSQATGAR